MGVRGCALLITSLFSQGNRNWGHQMRVRIREEGLEV